MLVKSYKTINYKVKMPRQLTSVQGPQQNPAFLGLINFIISHTCVTWVMC